MSVAIRCDLLQSAVTEMGSEANVQQNLSFLAKSIIVARKRFAMTETSKMIKHIAAQPDTT